MEVDADPGGQELQVARSQFLAQESGIGGHKTPVAKLCADVTGLLHLIQHHCISPTRPFNVLDDPPRTGCIPHMYMCLRHRSFLL